jgi:hypothetical protein
MGFGFFAANHANERESKALNLEAAASYYYFNW